jgi:hypothetical protein
MLKKQILNHVVTIAIGEIRVEQNSSCAQSYRELIITSISGETHSVKLYGEPDGLMNVHDAYLENSTLDEQFANFWNKAAARLTAHRLNLKGDAHV